jgi:deoxyribonuclease IV
MKFGVKIFSEREFADYFKDKADFLEVTAILGEDYSFLDDYPLPVVVHAMHSGFGINFTNVDLFEKNMEAVDFAVELADRCGAEKIIVHVGRLNGERCSVEQVVNFLKGLDERIIVENLTMRGVEGFFSRSEEVVEFIGKTGRKICFDVNHAMEVAYNDGVDYYDCVKDFVKMRPEHFHLGGGIVGDVERQHLNFKDSDFSVEKILKMLPSDAWVTIETTTDIEEVEKDLKFLRRIESDIRN